MTAPVGNVVASVTNALAPVTNALAPVTNALAPVTNALAPVTNALAPVTNAVAPVTNLAAPVPVVDHIFSSSGQPARHPANGDAATSAPSVAPVSFTLAPASLASTSGTDGASGLRPSSGAPSKAPEQLPSMGGTGAGAGFSGFFFGLFGALLVMLALAAPALMRRLEGASAFLRPPLFVCALERPG
jgi:hypothetical protein